MEQKERTRTSISPIGLNKSTPDNVVEDGALEVCHNLRFANGAWRNVQEFEQKPMPQIDGYDILYKHPATPENEYIAIAKEESSNDTPTLYAYLSNDKLFYSPLPLADNNVNEQPFYDNNLSQLGYIVDWEEYADGTAGATVLTTPALDTLRVYGFNIKTRDNNAPQIDQLYFPEGKPTIGSIAMQYGNNGKAEFSYYGTIEDYNQGVIILSNLAADNVSAEDTFGYDLITPVDINVGDTHSTMYKVEYNGKTLYLAGSNYEANGDSLAYIEENGEFKLCFISAVGQIGDTFELKYFVLERFFEGIQTLTVPSLLEPTVVEWYKTLDLKRSPSDDLKNAHRDSPVYNILISNNSISIKQEICRVSEQLSVSHFGNMLLLKNSTEREINYYLYDNGTYRPYADGLSLSFTITRGVTANPNVRYTKTHEINEDYAINTWELIGNSDDTSAPLATTKGEFFRGEFAIFAALRSADGSILYRTPIQIFNELRADYTVQSGYNNITNETGKMGIYTRTYLTYEQYVRITTEEHAAFYTPYSLKFVMPEIVFSGSLHHKDVYDVAFYSTRLHSYLVGGRVNEVDLLAEPFYLLKSLPKDDLEYESDSFVIKALDITNVIHQPEYKPNQDGYLYSDNLMENNNHLHLLGTTKRIEQLAPDTLSESQSVEDYSSSRTNAVLLRKYENKTLVTTSKATPCFARWQPRIISFHGKVDYLYITNQDNETYNKFSLQYTPATDISYFIKRHPTNDMLKYDYIDLDTDNITKEELQLQNATDTVTLPNRISVSELNNPTSYPNKLSYRIGSSINRIISANSAAIEMSDAKFGEFPLYVFTTEGIYAMQSGTETLYSAIVPIAKDVAINANTLAVNGAVLFFTDKGLHSLSRNGVQLLSAGLHKDDNRIPEWMYTCKLAHLPEYNEVMCLLMDGENTTGKAYVFSLDNNCWSERDVPQGQILNNNEVLCVESIHNLVNEGEDVVATIELETRPIKLGASKELKRLETLIVRFEADKDEELEVIIKGSVDGVEYKDLRRVSVTTNTDVLIRRTPSSVKYLKFVVKSGSLQSSIRLIRFDTEHYLRFVRRMR